MKNFPSIKKNTDYRKVYAKGRSLKARNIVVCVMENGLSGNRLGVSVSRKIGNSVVRHGFVRKMREIFRFNNAHTEQGYDIVVIARYRAKEARYSELYSEYRKLLKGLDLAAWSSEEDPAAEKEELK